MPGKLPTGTIAVLEDKEEEKPFASGAVAIDERVSADENIINFEGQAERLKEYALAKGYRIKHLVKEVGFEADDTGPKACLRKKITGSCLSNTKTDRQPADTDIICLKVPGPLSLLLFCYFLTSDVVNSTAPMSPLVWVILGAPL